jgi:hypothetical protein
MGKTWNKISELLPGRTAKQCRDRFASVLDPSINKDDWTVEEDVKILALQKRYGNKWA